MYIWLKKWRQSFYKVRQTINYDMLVLNLRIFKLYSLKKVLTCYLILYVFFWLGCDIHACKLNEDVYKIEEVKTTIPKSKTNNQLYYVGV